MRYKTVGDIIQFAGQLHGALSKQYAELEQLTTSERASMILDYLNRHERQLADALVAYEADAADGIVDTWMQHSPEFQPESLVARVREVNLEDIDGIVQTALEVDDYLVGLYQVMAEKAEVEGVREVFESLLAMEDCERHRIARNAYRLKDL